VTRLVLCSLLLVGCAEGSEDLRGPDHGEPLDPDAAPIVVVDRFAMQRQDGADVPGPGVPVDFDADFFRRGLGPEGEAVAYYDFGPSSGFTMRAFRLVDEDGVAIDEQLPIVESVPGAEGYSDFWQLVDVTVPAGYLANSITSAAEVEATDYPQSLTTEVLNRPLVSDGSVARLASDGPYVRAWVDDEIALAFDFAEAAPRVRGDLVDYAPIYVCLTDSGTFCSEPDGTTHNVVDALPPSEGYSPLWEPSVYPESSFEAVVDLESALEANPTPLPMLVNCPVVEW